MQSPSKWVNFIVFFITSANAVCTGDILRVQPHEGRQPSTEGGSPSFSYHYQQLRGQPAQRIHIEYPKQTRTATSSPQPQIYPTSTPFNRVSSIKHDYATKIPPLAGPAQGQPQPFVEYPVEDGEDRKNTSNKLYFEDHNGNDTHREHHYRHVTVNHYYYNATNASLGADPSKGKDVKHHYYYNEYKHDHRNKTEDPNVKHHYYYNEYKHDHRNEGEDSNANHNYDDSEYNRTSGKGSAKYYHKAYTHENRNEANNANEHRNKTQGQGGAGVKHYYYATNRTVTRTEAPKIKHYYYKDEDNAEDGSHYDDYDESVGEVGDPQKREEELVPVPPITDAQGIEDYEYVTPDPKPIVKHHHYYKEYHYKNGHLVANKTRAEPPRVRPFRDFKNPHFESPKYVGFPIIPVVKDTPYDKRFAYVGGSGHAFFGSLYDPSYRSRRPSPNGSLGYYLVDPLGQLPIFRIHASLPLPLPLPESYPERTSRGVPGYRVDSSYPEAGTYHHHRATRVRRASVQTLSSLQSET